MKASGVYGKLRALDPVLGLIVRWPEKSIKINILRCLERAFLVLRQGRFAEVAELVDALDLGSSAARCESSSLSFRTKLIRMAVRSLVYGFHARELADAVANIRMF